MWTLVFQLRHLLLHLLPFASYFAGYRCRATFANWKNVIERMLMLSVGDEISTGDLPEEMRKVAPKGDWFLLDLPEEGISLVGIERELLVRAWEKHGGNQTQAARYLDISRRTLIYRMEKHGLRRDEDAEDS